MKNVIETILKHPIATTIVVSAVSEGICRIVHGGKKNGAPWFSISISRAAKEAAKEVTKDN